MHKYVFCSIKKYTKTLDITKKKVTKTPEIHNPSFSTTCCNNSRTKAQYLTWTL